MTQGEAIKLMYDFYLSDEKMAGETLISVLNSSAENNDDPSTLNSIIDECQKRGIDPTAAIAGAWKRQDDLFKLFTGDKR